MGQCTSGYWEAAFKDFAKRKLSVLTGLSQEITFKLTQAALKAPSAKPQRHHTHLFPSRQAWAFPESQKSLMASNPLHSLIQLDSSEVL